MRGTGGMEESDWLAKPVCQLRLATAGRVRVVDQVEIKKANQLLRWCRAKVRHGRDAKRFGSQREPKHGRVTNGAVGTCVYSIMCRLKVRALEYTQNR